MESSSQHVFGVLPWEEVVAVSACLFRIRTQWVYAGMYFEPEAFPHRTYCSAYALDAGPGCVDSSAVYRVSRRHFLSFFRAIFIRSMVPVFVAHLLYNYFVSKLCVPCCFVGAIRADLPLVPTTLWSNLRRCEPWAVSV